MIRPLVVSLFDLTGVMVRPWAEAGCECLCLDLQHSIRADRVERFPSGGSIRYRWWNALSGALADFERRPYAVFGFPPCTHLAVSGARDFARKGLGLLIDALTLVERCRLLCEFADDGRWMLENPVSRLSTLWRAPDYTFHPHEYAGYLADPAPEAYTKKTCLWTGPGFRMPSPRSVEPTLGGLIHRMPPSPERANRRSATPAGLARAVFEANHPRVFAEAVA